jgi:hypothetical protein
MAFRIWGKPSLLIRLMSSLIGFTGFIRGRVLEERKRDEQRRLHRFCPEAFAPY